jgi:hypothetical protein
VAISSCSSIFLPLFSVVENIALPLLLLDGLSQSHFDRYAMNALLRISCEIFFDFVNILPT